jgi:hypothetical protein
METQRWRAEDRDMKDGRDVKKMKMKIDRRWRCEGCSQRSLTSNWCEDMKVRRCEDTKIRRPDGNECDEIRRVVYDTN